MLSGESVTTTLYDGGKIVDENLNDLPNIIDSSPQYKRFKNIAVKTSSTMLRIDFLFGMEDQSLFFGSDSKSNNEPEHVLSY